MFKHHYDTDGVVRFDQLFHQDTIQQCHHLIDLLEEQFTRCADPSQVVFDKGYVKQIQYLHKHHSFFGEMIEHLRPLAQALTGEKELYVLNMQLFENHPRSSEFSCQARPANAITFWISLDDISYLDDTHRSDTKPGDVLAHHSKTLHKVDKNESSKRSRAIGVVFIPSRRDNKDLELRAKL